MRRDSILFRTRALPLILGGLAVFGLFALSACRHPDPPASSAQNLTVGKVQGEIKVGMSASDVAEILGSPNIVTTDEKRREVWIYDKVSTESVDTQNSFGGSIIILGGSDQPAPALGDPEDADDHHQVRRGEEGPRLCVQLLPVLVAARAPALRAGRRDGRRDRRWPRAVVCSRAAATGPKTTSKDFFVLTPESAANKSMQTRQFETRDADELLSASAAVLQDLGFQVTESDRSLGFLRAAKERSAREYGQEMDARPGGLPDDRCSSAFGGQNATLLMPVDLQQQINASLVAHPIPDDGDGARNEVRIVFYRLVWKGDGQSGDTYIPPGEQKMEMIRDAGLYQRFFARLGKAVFLEAEKI